MALLLAAALAVPAAADSPSDAVVTDGGEILRARDGFYSELFPEGDAAPPNIRVLALDIESTAGTQRLLVPTSETWRPERSPTVIWDSTSETSILLWLSGTGVAGSFTVEFVSRHDDAWSEVSSGRNSSGTPVIFDHQPEVFVSSSRLAFDTPAGPASVSRQVVHLIWREAATERLLYMPLVFLDGTYIGRSDVVALSQVLFKANENNAESTGMSASLRSLFAVREEGDSLLLALADPEHDHIGVIAVDLLPISLVALADDVLDRILDFPEELDDDGMQTLSGEIRAQIISVGYTLQLNPAVTEYTAIRVADWMSDADAGLDLDELARGARHQTLEIGSSVIAHTVNDPTSPGGDITELDLGEFLGDGGEADGLKDLVRLDVRFDVEAPPLDAPNIEALIGSKGERLILTWSTEDGSALRYVEYKNRDGAWSDAITLPLGESFDHQQALELLRRRLR